MSTILNIQSQTPERTAQVLRLIHSAVSGEMQRLQMAIRLAEQRLAGFERKYHIDSAAFLAQWSAEDVEGGDDEYVEWSGEYQLYMRLQEHLRHLQE